jgi:blocked-early-in-transport protein 1
MRYRQNNALLQEMANKASALRSVTVDIYDNARNQDIIDANVCSSFI